MPYKNHHLLPHTYAPRELHKSRALKLRNLLIEGRESVGNQSS